MNLKDLLKKYADLVAEQKGILDKGDALSAEELTRAEAINPELDVLDADIKRLESLEDTRQKNAARQKHLDTIERPEFAPEVKTGEPADQPSRIIVRGGKADNFKGNKELAYRFGQWFLGCIGNQKAAAYCAKNGIKIVKSHSENDNSSGGYLVPEEFENDLIDLREQYGIFRKWSKVSKMKSDTKTVPRRKGGLTAYFVGEGEPITESKKAWNRVKLTAKKLAVLAIYTNELDEDAIVDMGNDLAGEISYAFAQKEDDCGFNGDGTEVYGGIVGVRNKLIGLSATRANIAGLVVGSGNAWSELLLSDFSKVKGRLPKYARTPKTGWFASQTFYHEVMEKLMLASGGVTAAEVAAGRVTEVFMGYPVQISQVLPEFEANDDIPVLFGDLSLAALFGDRRQTTLAMSEHLNFDTDEIALRGTERFDINVHDVGNADAVAKNRKPGPIVGLITAAA